MHIDKKTGMFRRLLAKLGRRFRRFSRDQDGTTAIEFGIVALPFLALLFAIIETGLVFLAGQTLETAVADSARLILTGQAQTAQFKAEDFRQAVCDRINGLIDCANIYIDVRTFPKFSTINFAPLIDNNGQLNNNFVYDAGAAGDIVVVRLLYAYPVYVHLWNPSLPNIDGNKRLLVAMAAFRNEPF